MYGPLLAEAIGMVRRLLLTLLLLTGWGTPCRAFDNGLTAAIRALPVWADWWVLGEGDGPLPVVLPANGVVTSHFGGRRHPLWHEWCAHNGVDIADRPAAPIRSTQTGLVDSVGWRGGYGLAVEVDHGHGWHSLYAHLAQVEVRRGDVVRAGARIGTMGATGWATGPHLHFELRYCDTPIDPLPYLLRLAHAKTRSSPAPAWPW